MGCVYLITDLTNGLQYVGKTIQAVNRRWRGHCKSRKQDYFHRAIRLRGPESFTLEVLEESDDEDFLFEVEKIYIEELGTRFPGGYNLTDGGEGPSGLRHTEESKQKMSFPGNKNGFFGKHHTEESIEKNRAAHLGKVVSEETRAKISKSLEGKHPRGMLGKHHSEETKQKQREWSSKRRDTDETRNKKREVRLKYLAEHSFANMEAKIAELERKLRDG